MDKTGIYSKTPQGLQEVENRGLKLPPKLRQLLIMVDGQTDVGALMDRFDSQDNVAGRLSALEHMGLIENPDGSAASDSPEEGDIADLRSDISHMITDALGPEADALTIQIEECRTLKELREQCGLCHTILTNALGKAKADAFWAKASGMLG